MTLETILFYGVLGLYFGAMILYFLFVAAKKEGIGTPTVPPPRSSCRTAASSPDAQRICSAPCPPAS